MDVKLVVQRSGQMGQTFNLRSAEMIIGRQKGCGVRIPSAQVSRQHCLVSYKDDLVAVEDLASANGTFINGRRIQKREYLRPGDKLKVGPITLLVQYQLTQAAIAQLLLEDTEEVVVSPLDDEVEVLEESADAGAEVELLIEGDDATAPLVLDDEEPVLLTPEEDQEAAAQDETEQPETDPLEALRAIEAKASGKAPPPTRKKSSGLGKTQPPPQVKPAPPAPPRRKAVPKKPLAPVASDDEDSTSPPEDARPDASLIMGHKNWELPTGEDIRDILSQIEKGKKK